MKKLFATILAIAMLAIPLASCSPKGSSVEDCCAEVISLMKEMVDCEEYSEIYGLPAMYGDTVAQLQNVNDTKPEAIYELDLSESTWLSKEIGTVDFPDALNDYVHSALYVSIASKINEKAGAEAMVIAATFSAQKTFVCESVKENTVFLYVYEDTAIAVSVLPGASGSVSVCGNFIINDGFRTDDAAQIENSLAEIGIDGVVAKKK